MQKKLLYVFSFILFIVLLTYFVTESARENKAKDEVVCEKIEYFTKNYFRFVEKVMVDSGYDEMSVSVSFIPEVGSFPVKEEIYQTIAHHALQIVTFFPEVIHFDYIVLWDDYTKQEVLSLSINEDALKRLANIYNEEYLNQNSGFETSFKKVFSSIVETDESRSWRDIIDKYSDIP